MPFRSFRRDIPPGDPVHLFTAEAGDKYIEVRAAALSDDNMSVGFTFRIGGPDMAKTGGLVCFNSEWSSEIEQGDEVWVQVYGAAFTETTPITAIVRSSRVESRGAVKPVSDADPDDPAPARAAVRASGSSRPANASGRSGTGVPRQSRSKLRR